MSAHAQARQPAGVPVGGQFATTAHAEPNLALVADHPPLRETSRGVWGVVNATATIDGDGSTRIHLSGNPPVRAESGMVALRMERAEQTDALHNKLRNLAGGKATVLMRAPTGNVIAREGTLFMNGDAIGLVNKGDRSGKGIWLVDPRRPNGLQILGVTQGYGGQHALAADFRDYADSLPQVDDATFDDIPEWDGVGEPPSAIAAVYVLDHPGFDGDQDGRGSMFFVTDFQPGDGSPTRDGAGVVNGYGVYAASSGLESEHGSMYASDLKRFGGRVKGYRPGSHTFRDVMGLAKIADRGDDIEQVWESVAAASR